MPLTVSGINCLPNLTFYNASSTRYEGRLLIGETANGADRNVSISTEVALGAGKFRHWRVVSASGKTDPQNCYAWQNTRTLEHSNTRTHGESQRSTYKGI